MTGPKLENLEPKPKTLGQRAFDALRDAIIAKTLAPGAMISETHLAADLGISKTPVREAVLRLRALNLLEEDGDSRLIVVRPSARRITQAYELRIALERFSAEKAAQWATEKEKDGLTEHAEASLDAAREGDGAGFRSHDVDFHKLLCRASANSLLAQQAENAIDLTDILRARDIPITDATMACAKEHVAIASTLRAGDGVEASRLVDAHISGVQARMLDLFIRTGSNSGDVA